MRTFTLAFITLMIGFHTSHAQEKKQNQRGLPFSDLSLQEGLEQAKKENKMLFLDAYATWCGPCKQMDRTTFRDPQVASYFAKHFISVKTDVDAAEGKALARKYSMQSVPTYLFFKSDGSIAKEIIGYHKPLELLKVARWVINKK